MKRVLYVQHATAMGGSVLSLLYLIQKLDRTRYTPVVACLGQEGVVTDFYRQRGIEALACPEISILPHTTGGWLPLYNPWALLQLAATIGRFPGGVRATRHLIDRVSPDLIHLNSVVLLPSAIGAARSGVPIVWHVREAVVRGHLGFRRALIRRLLRRLPSEVVFISSDEQEQTRLDGRGINIPNFVDFGQFNRHLDREACRRDLGLLQQDHVVLFVGGVSEIKGIRPLLDAMRLERARNPRIHALIGAAVTTPSRNWVARLARVILPFVGRRTPRQRATAFIERHQMAQYVHLLPFCQDVEKLLAACDLLVFPSTAPHFARPVIEAGAMGKPVVASCIGGVKELVDDGETGLLVPPGDAATLANAMHRILLDPAMAARMGERGFERAFRLYNADINAEATVAVYDRILKDAMDPNCVNGSVPS